MKLGKEKQEEIFLEKRQADLINGHQEACVRFQEALMGHMEEGLLTEAQATIVMEHVVRLGERDRNAPNTGNLQDLFSSTLIDTKDPLRSFAQVLADSVKVIPMPDDAALLPPMKDMRKDSETSGKIFTAVKDLPLGAPQKMLASHTNVAYADQEMAESAKEMIKACEPDIEAKALDERFHQMVAQSQHMPSSSFVLAATTGLVFQTDQIFEKAGYSKEEVAATRGFFEASSKFNPKWLALFMGSGPRDDPEYLAWLDEYHQHRAGLPEDLKYQLMTDTLTNFHPCTMLSGKWVDASVQFGNVKKVEEIPTALAKIVNQYLAEFEDLHREPASRFIEGVSPTLKEYGVSHSIEQKAFIGATQAPQQELIAQQFEDAWHRKIVAGVLRCSPLFTRLGEGLSTRLLDCFERVVFSDAEVILKKGQEGNGLFVIVEGTVSVTFPASEDSTSPVELKTGDVFGEISLLSEGVTTASVTSVKETVALVLRPNRFQQILKRYSDVQDFLVKLAEERMEELHDEKREWIVTGK